MQRVVFSSLIAGVCVLPLAAQVPVGTQAPEIQFKKGWNGAPPTLSELRGKLVLLDFFATW